MLALRDLQRRFSDSLLSGAGDEVVPLIEGDAASARTRLAIYRRNREAATINALKLTYPAVAALVGDDFFTQTARAFSRAYPPTSALFALYGDAFAEFLETVPGAASLPYLADIARLEWAVALSASCSHEFLPAFVLGDAVVSWPTSLNLLKVNFPAAAIWTAALAGDEAALERIDPSRAPATLAIWRQGDGAKVAVLGAAAAAFVAAMRDGAEIDAALARAEALSNDPIAVLTAEVLQADFVRFTPSS